MNRGKLSEEQTLASLSTVSFLSITRRGLVVWVFSRTPLCSASQDFLDEATYGRKIHSLLEDTWRNLNSSYINPSQAFGRDFIPFTWVEIHICDLIQ